MFQLFYCNSYSSTVEINVDIDCSSISIPSKYIKSSESKERYFEWNANMMAIKISEYVHMNRV